jgi:chloramphenicol-sensitive protein RarD
MAHSSQDQDTLAGFAYALTAYVLWGFLPLFMKLIAHIPPVEVVAHRVIWSAPLAAGLLLITGRTADLKAALKSPNTLMMGVVTAILIAVNWSIYVWAIASDRTLDASLGYYINPLFSIFLASVLLRERLSRAQIIALSFAGIAVLILTVDAGKLPVAALGLTLSWGFYAYFKKSLPVGPNQGFMLEVLILLPLAIGYVIYLSYQGDSHFLTTPGNTLLLLGCGVVTAVPLMFYANGAKLLRLSTIAMMQYIAPTMIFIIAVFVFNEPFGSAKMVAFPLIWLSLVVYSLSVFRSR